MKRGMKKSIVLLAVATLSLGGCGSKNTEVDTTEATTIETTTEKTTTEEATTEATTKETTTEMKALAQKGHNHSYRPLCAKPHGSALTCCEARSHLWWV